MTERKWVLREIDEEVCGRLQAELGVLPLTAKLILRRGFDTVSDALKFIKIFMKQYNFPSGHFRLYYV